MKYVRYGAFFAAAAIAASSALAQSWTPPPESARCPSKWGAGDERGAANYMTPKSVLTAIKSIKTGEVIELGHGLNATIPFFFGRSYNLASERIILGPPPYFLGSNLVGGNEEEVTATIGQIGTQFDGFAHISHADSFYNCFKFDDIWTPTGFTKLGIENAGTLIARGVLIDVAAYKRVDMLPENYEITVADLDGALRRQNRSYAQRTSGGIRPGDVVLIHTGWGKLWGIDNARYGTSNPGIGIKAAEWLLAKNPMVLASDNWAVEVVPNPDPNLAFPVHQLAIVVNGVHLLESVKLDELAAKRVYEFAFIVQPLKLEGATGSTVAPVAVR
jgi:kynurenine formamidase